MMWISATQNGHSLQQSPERIFWFVSMPTVRTILTMAPSTANPYLSQELIAECQKLSQCIITTFCASTGANNQGVYQTDEMSGLNWCSIPATIVEMGYMTNPDEDTRMQTAEYQQQMVTGIADGIDQYFAS